MNWSVRRRQVLLFASVLLACAFLAEIALRCLGLSFPIVDREDEFTGWGYEPYRSWTYREEGYGEIEINSYGYRDKDWEVEKSAGTVRIAVLGDSYVDALQVQKEDRFTERLEKMLEERKVFKHQHVEVMNFGISGFGTSQELQTLRHRVLPFQPDVVILACLTGNDIRDNSLKLDGNHMRPFFSLEGEELRLDDSFLETPGYRGGWLKSTVRYAAKYSVLAQLAIKIRRASEKRSRLANSQCNGEVGLDDAIYAEPEGDWEDAWRVTERLIREMRDDSVKANAAFFLVTLSNAEQVQPDLKSGEDAAQSGGVKDLFYPERRLGAYAEKHGIAVLHLAPELQRIAQREQKHLHGFSDSNLGSGHWNRDGHKAAAELIAEWLESKLSAR